MKRALVSEALVLQTNQKGQVSVDITYASILRSPKVNDALESAEKKIWKQNVGLRNNASVTNVF